MMPADDVADSIIVRFPKAAPPVPVARRSWLSLAFWLIRRIAEGIGWLALVGLVT